MVYWIGLAFTLLFGILVFRIVVRRDYHEQGKLRPVAVLSEFLIFGLHANLPYLYLDATWPSMPPLPDNPIQRWAGLVICCLGLAATILIMSRLGFGTSTGKTPAGLQTTGPYSISRNPQLLTYSLILIGAGILYPSLQSLAWILLFAVIAYLMVITEEEHLKNLFGQAYTDYCKQVPRFIINWTKNRKSETQV